MFVAYIGMYIVYIIIMRVYRSVPEMNSEHIVVKAMMNSFSRKNQSLKTIKMFLFCFIFHGFISID